MGVTAEKVPEMLPEASGWIWWRQFCSIPAIKAEPKMGAAVLEKI